MTTPDESRAIEATIAGQRGTTVDFLDTATFWSNVGVVVFGILAAITAAFALYFGGKLGAAKDAELIRFQSESKAAIAAADARAAEANAKAKASEALVASADAASKEAVVKVAEAQRASAEASAKAEGFRLDIAEANERAAAANAMAERERLARLQLEARLADRVITADQEARLKIVFSRIKGHTVDLTIFNDSPETANVVNSIFGCLTGAGVLTTRMSPFASGGVRGVILGVSPSGSAAEKAAVQGAVSILRETLGNGVGVEDFAKLDATKASGMTGESEGALQRGQAAIRIWIGPK